MKKTLPIVAVTAAALTIGASIAFANSNNSLYKTIGTPTLRDGQIVFNSESVRNVDDVYWSFDLEATTKSGYGTVTVEDCYAGGTDVEFKNTISGKKYMFTATGNYPGDAYFFIEIWISSIYSFESVTVAGLFNGDSETTYKTYDLYNPGTKSPKVVDVDDGDAVLTISSGAMDNNYSSVALESITINYKCLA